MRRNSRPGSSPRTLTHLVGVGQLHAVDVDQLEGRHAALVAPRGQHAHDRTDCGCLARPRNPADVHASSAAYAARPCARVMRSRQRRAARVDAACLRARSRSDTNDLTASYSFSRHERMSGTDPTCSRRLASLRSPALGRAVRAPCGSVRRTALSLRSRHEAAPRPARLPRFAREAHAPAALGARLVTRPARGGRYSSSLVASLRASTSRAPVYSVRLTGCFAVSLSHAGGRRGRLPLSCVMPAMHTPRRSPCGSMALDDGDGADVGDRRHVRCARAFPRTRLVRAGEREPADWPARALGARRLFPRDS